jgi:hypothetical protein
VMCSYFTALADTAAEQQVVRERLLYQLQAVAPAFRPTAPTPHRTSRTSWTSSSGSVP